MKNIKKRKFKTRNGSIIIEDERSGTWKRNGYIDDYKIIKSTCEEYKKGTPLSLALVWHETKPIGGAHGNGWDIIEEVF